MDTSSSDQNDKHNTSNTDDLMVVEVTEEKKKLAEEFKAKGNDFFKVNNIRSALPLYTRAIETNPFIATYYANRAICHLKMENYGSALLDADKAISLDPSFIKAHYRKGTAYFALAKYKEALSAFKEVTKIHKDKDALLKIKECKAALRAEAFAKAIESEKTKPVSETVDVKSIEVEDSYGGPRLKDDGEVTEEFVVELMKWQEQQKKLHKKYVLLLILNAIKVLSSLPTLVDVPVPEGTEITVCGDVHGQYYDVLNIFKLNGMPSEKNPYLFNGDFVDRGSFSIEVIILFFALKLLYPNHFHMSRGNHESSTLNQVYGFRGECLHKYDNVIFDLFNESFCHLPLGFVLGKKVLVVHGGLFSQDNVTLDDLRKIDRRRQPPDSGLMCEILWSDPQPFPGRAPSKRGVGLAFGPDVTHHFLKLNGLELLVRSHEVKADGYEVEADGKLVTVFSAPNYCDQMGNKGAFIRFNSNLKPKYTSFSAVPHPPVRPMAYASGMLSGM